MCDYVNMKIDNNISNDELDKLVSKMIYVLKSINKSSTIDYDNEKHIVEKIYETAYNVIKLEIIARAESQLYLFVKNEDVNISYFNNLILKDVEIQLTKYLKHDGAIEEFILYLAYVLVLFMAWLASVNPYDGNAIISFKF